MRHIQKGGKAVIFPEGDIATDGPLPVQRGAAALWVRSGVPLIPLRYSGAEDWRLAPGGRQWFPRITLEIGDPISAPVLIEDAVRRIEREIFTPPAMCLGDLSQSLPGPLHHPDKHGRYDRAGKEQHKRRFTQIDGGEHRPARCQETPDGSDHASQPGIA